MQEIAVKAKFCCKHLWRICDTSAFFCHCHHSAPESEKLMDKKIREQIDTITYLPEELISDILLRLPVEVLHETVRFVCRHWSYIIHDPVFVEAHLQRSKTGLFIESAGSPGSAHFLEINDDQFRLTECRHKFRGTMLASCDGVALFSGSNDNTTFYVANLVTKEVEMLPHLDSPPNPLYYGNCIARVPSTGQYKVVHAYEDLNKEYHWLTLTVGIDNLWRKISCQQIYSRENVDLDNFPVSVGGVIYWTDYDFEVDGIIYFLATNTADETIHEVPIPSGSQEPCAYTKMGDYLSGFITAPPSLQFEICILKDWRRGEWAKIYQIDMELCQQAPQDMFFYFPVGWLNNDEVLVLEGSTSQGDIYLAYDVKKNKIIILDLSTCGFDFYTQVHTNTMVSWNMP